MSTLTQDTVPQIALAFYKAVVDGYSKREELRENPHWQILFRQREAIEERLLRQAGETQAFSNCIQKATENALSALSYRVHNALPPHIEGYVIAKGDKRELFKMQIYLGEAFDIVRQINTDDGLNAEEIIQQANERTQQKLEQIFEI